MRRIAAAALCVVFLASPVGAMVWSGNDLVKFMKEYDKAENPGQTPVSWEDAGFYVGFVVGVFSAHEEGFEFTGAKLRQMCAIVGKYLKDHPDQWHRDAHDLAYAALKQAFGKKRQQ